MPITMPTRIREYDLSLDEYTEEAPAPLLIEGYEVEFDKKVKTTPVEVVAANKPVIIKEEAAS